MEGGFREVKGRESFKMGIFVNILCYWEDVVKGGLKSFKCVSNMEGSGDLRKLLEGWREVEVRLV